jgi:hypothetical protein
MTPHTTFAIRDAQTAKARPHGPLPGGCAGAGGAALLAGCGSVGAGVGVGIPVGPVSVGVGMGSGVSAGVGRWGPLGVGVG